MPCILYTKCPALSFDWNIPVHSDVSLFSLVANHRLRKSLGCHIKCTP